MIRIKKCIISRYRSILSLALDISSDTNLVAICGQNNVGKTNTLRAINLFFHPEYYMTNDDMPRIKHATGGQSIHSKIEILFWDDDIDVYYDLCRDFKTIKETNEGLSGEEYTLEGKKKHRSRMSVEQIKTFLSKIEFVYIESINTFVPELIENITEGIIDVEYDKARFSQSKKELKDAYDKYIDGLSKILETFANDISDTFKLFRENWKVEFQVPKNSDTFRDLISNDVHLYLNDSGSIGVLDKGAGLQRLATILLNFEMLSRINRKKNVIICIDEPDAYLHEGLQKKLKGLFDSKSNTMQILFTTHSKVFINEYNMSNVFLLEAEYSKKYSQRKKKEINVIETKLVNIKETTGYKKVCDHLGIEMIAYELLEKNNILVEGKCDEKYLTELFNFFSIECPNIESLNGADNAVKYLSFYDSYYKNNEVSYKPIIKVVLDNDNKGREIYSKINSTQYQNIVVKALLLPNHTGTGNFSIEKNSTNNEIEDFLYPEIMVVLINLLLEKKHMIKIKSKSVCKKIHTASFAAKGILDLCEYEKNSVNPERGAEISFVSSGNQTNKVKEGLAGMFNIRGNQSLINQLNDCDMKYPKVKEFLIQLSNFDAY